MENEQDSSYAPRRLAGAFPRPSKVRRCDDSTDGASERIGDHLDPVYPFCTLSSIGPLPPLFQAGDGLQINGTKLEVKVLDPIVIKNTAVSAKFDNCSIGLNKMGELTVIPRIVFQITTELPVSLKDYNRFFLTYDKTRALHTVFPGAGLSVRLDEDYFIVADDGKLRLWWAAPKYIPCEAPIVSTEEGVKLKIERPLSVDDQNRLKVNMIPHDPIEVVKQQDQVKAIQIKLNSVHFTVNQEGKLTLQSTYWFKPGATAPMAFRDDRVQLDVDTGADSVLEVAEGQLRMRLGPGIKADNFGLHLDIGKGLALWKERHNELLVEREYPLIPDDTIVGVFPGQGVTKNEDGALTAALKHNDSFLLSNGTLVPRTGRGIFVDETNGNKVSVKIKQFESPEKLKFDEEGYLVLGSGAKGTLKFDDDGNLTLV